jgi:hypothetical protein
MEMEKSFRLILRNPRLALIGNCEQIPEAAQALFGSRECNEQPLGFYRTNAPSYDASEWDFIIEASNITAGLTCPLTGMAPVEFKFQDGHVAFKSGKLRKEACRTGGWSGTPIDAGGDREDFNCCSLTSAEGLSCQRRRP